jgi:TolB protein
LKTFRSAAFARCLAAALCTGLAGCDTEPGPVGAGNPARTDGAERLTRSESDRSCQNPSFSPDGRFLLFTRFLDGYNHGPSELVVLDLGNRVETVIVPAGDSDNVNAPAFAWVGGLVCWASDRGGAAEEVYAARADGTGIRRVTRHPASEGGLIEPSFNPLDTAKIVLEAGRNGTAPHWIALAETDRGGRVTALTLDERFDDRLPAWSPDGARICFQRASRFRDDWRTWTAEVRFSADEPPALAGSSPLEQPAGHHTDNSWSADGRFILSSSDALSEIPNIVAFPVPGGEPVAVTRSASAEDGAPSASPDGLWIAFESHRGPGEDAPSDIWRIPNPLFRTTPSGR